MTDFVGALRPGTRIVLPCIVLAAVSGVGAYGWWPVLLPALGACPFAFLWMRERHSHSRHPEYGWALAFVLAEATMAMGIALGRDSHGSSLVLLVMPVVAVSVLFRRRAVIAAAALGGLAIIGVAFACDLHEVVADPPVLYDAVFALVSLVLTSLVLRDLDDAYRRSALVDDLTRALNRAALVPRLAELTYQAETADSPVALIVADIDHFKSVNDQHGHAVGDAVLGGVVKRMSECVSAFEPIYRLGGEEFLILLPGLGAAAAEDVALAMWQAVRESPIHEVQVRMSFGVASSAGGRFDLDLLFARADRALYAAKQGGRDWVRVAPELTPSPASAVLGRGPEPPAGALAPGDRGPASAVAPEESRLVGVGVSPEHGWTRGLPGSGSEALPVTEELAREHLRDVTTRLTRTFLAVAAGAFALTAVAIPWYGWHDLIAPLIGAIPYYVLSRAAHRFPHPDRVLLSGWMIFQASIAIGFICASTAPLFALPLLVLLVPGRCAILRPGAAAGAVLYTGLLMVGVAFAFGATRIVDDPALLLLPMALLVQVGHIGTVVGRSAVGYRSVGVVDGLTGLLRRTALRTRVMELEAQSETARQPVAMLLIDIDNFKEINDHSGHAAGDLVLREVAARISASLRTYESAYRVGGEELLVLLPSADRATALEIAERVRTTVSVRPCGVHSVTVSIGVGVTAPGERFVYDTLFARSDAALYEAKRTGRNRVCSAPPGTSPGSATALDRPGAPDPALTSS